MMGSTFTCCCEMGETTGWQWRQLARRELLANGRNGFAGGGHRPSSPSSLFDSWLGEHFSRSLGADLKADLKMRVRRACCCLEQLPGWLVWWLARKGLGGDVPCEGLWESLLGKDTQTSVGYRQYSDPSAGHMSVHWALVPSGELEHPASNGEQTDGRDPPRKHPAVPSGACPDVVRCADAHMGGHTYTAEPHYEWSWGNSHMPNQQVISWSRLIQRMTLVIRGLMSWASTNWAYIILVRSNYTK